LAHHPVEVFRIEELLPHPQADLLSIVKIRGFTCCVRTADYQVGDLVAYIEPDSLVPVDRSEFVFLAKVGSIEPARIRAKKLRGIISMGLLVKAPPGFEPGQDAGEALGVQHYEPPCPVTGGESESPPKGHFPVYDVENWRRYQEILQPGELVQITEKIHGANGRWTYQDGRYWCGSHTQWKREDPNNLWWKALEATPALKNLLLACPDRAVYGEVYGQVQDLKYEMKGVGIRVFDIWAKDRGCWLNDDEFNAIVASFNLSITGNVVPRIFVGPLPDHQTLIAMSEGQSRIANHIQEGIVIKPLVERTDPEIGRVILKVISSKYLERS